MNSGSDGPRRLYALALYATRPAGGAAAPHEHEVYLHVALAVAGGEDEARAKMKERLRELCPPGRGWVNHHVTPSHVSKESLRELLAAVSEDEEGAADGGEGSDDSDFLM